MRWPLPSCPRLRKPWVLTSVSKPLPIASSGSQIDNPRFFREEEAALARAQRRLAKEAKGTPQRRKRRKVVARVHERIRWRRENFVQQESRRLVNHYGLIAVEALVVRNLMKRPKAKQDAETGGYLPNGAAAKAGLNKSIADAAWAVFFDALVAIGKACRCRSDGTHARIAVWCGIETIMPL